MKPHVEWWFKSRYKLEYYIVRNEYGVAKIPATAEPMYCSSCTRPIRDNPFPVVDGQPYCITCFRNLIPEAETHELLIKDVKRRRRNLNKLTRLLEISQAEVIQLLRTVHETGNPCIHYKNHLLYIYVQDKGSCYLVSIWDKPREHPQARCIFNGETLKQL